MKYLILETMGCNFSNRDNTITKSDCENYRIETRGELVKSNDGREYFLSFTHGTRYQYRKTHKITGKPLKHTIKELLNENALHVDTAFYNENGCFRNCELETNIYNMKLSFTKADILKAVNTFAAETFDRVEILNTINIWKIAGYREKEILQSQNRSFEIVQDDGTYKVFRITDTATGNYFEYESNNNRITG